MESPESKWTKNCCFKSIEKYDAEGKLTKVMQGEFNPKTGEPSGRLLVIIKGQFSVV